MTVLIEHGNGVNGQYCVSEAVINTLEDLLPLIRRYIQAGACVYQLGILPNREGESWT